MKLELYFRDIMRLTTTKDERYAIIQVEEMKLTAANAPDLKTEFLFLNSEGQKNLICDLTKVDYVDSSGLSAFLVAERICNKVNGSFIIANCNDNVKKLLELSHLDSILTLTPTVKEAIDLILLNELERDLRD